MKRPFFIFFIVILSLVVLSLVTKKIQFSRNWLVNLIKKYQIPQGDSYTTDSTAENNILDIPTQIDVTEDEKALGYTDSRKIVESSNGNLYVAYRKQEKSDAKYGVYVAKSVDGGKTWQLCNGGESISKDIDSFDQRVPSITLDNQNNVHVVWYGRDPERVGKNQREIKYSSSDSSCENWSIWRNIALIEGYNHQSYWQEHPVVIYGNKNLYVVWEGKDKKNNNNQQIKFIRSADGGNSWTSPKNIIVTPKNTQSRPSLIVRKDGSLLIYAYTSYKIPGHIQQIQISVSKDNGDNWSEWQNLSNTSEDARHVSAVQDNNGDIYFAWRQSNRGKSKIFWTKLEEDKVSQPQPITPKNTNQFSPSISLIGKKIAVAFTQTDNFNNLPKEDFHFPGTSLIYAKDINGTEWKKLAEINGINIVLVPIGFKDRVSGILLQKNESSYDVKFIQSNLGQE